MDQMLGQVMLFAGNYAPKGWAFCQGQLLPIASNSALFSLLGTYYGGDGRTTFGLPDLRSRVPVGAGYAPGLSNITVGRQFGTETNTLNVSNLPSHTHTAAVSTNSTSVGASSEEGTTDTPTGNYLAAGSDGANNYATSADTTMATGSVQLNATVTIGQTGANQAINNMQPSLGMNYIIALEGYYPSRS